MGPMNSERLAMWYDTYSAPLVLYARHWLPDDAAEDAVQSVFMRLTGRMFRPRNVQAWLFRMVRNEAITRLRRRDCRRRHMQKRSTQQSLWFEGSIDDLIDARAAQEMLTDLPMDQREVVILRIWGQLSLREIARINGCAVTTVHSRYKAALAAIKQRMQSSCKTMKD